VNKYFGDHHVLKDITLKVEQGEKIVNIGPSGSGKSTLIRSMNQLEKVNDGSVVIDYIDITKPTAPIQKVRQIVAMV
ncbi:ATP-binding cassette domain-containing protein, partial [Enterococcus faecalis]|uniref:ATP-binding cassette domain-containing protein n=1 Tax=Enterococcus faecalis TaxID=1351 RepID=UPI003CC65441